MRQWRYELNRKWSSTFLIAILASLLTLTVVAYEVGAQIAAGSVRQSGVWTVQPGNTANTTAWLVTGTGGTFPVTGTFWQGTQPVSGTFWQTTQPVSAAGLTSIATGQQAVTASAVALPNSAGKQVCVKVLIAGTQVVYYGPSGVTTSTGQELSPGDASCMTLDNSNRVFVIAGSTGSTVGWQVLN